MSRITQRMSLHLNCGKDGHCYVFKLFVDDKPTNIQRFTSSKHGKKSDDRLLCGDEEFDLMGAKPDAAEDFILERVTA